MIFGVRGTGKYSITIKSYYEGNSRAIGNAISLDLAYILSFQPRTAHALGLYRSLVTSSG